MTNQNNEFGKSPVKLSSPTQIWIDDVNQNNELRASIYSILLDVGVKKSNVSAVTDSIIQALYAPKPVENGELRDKLARLEVYTTVKSEKHPLYYKDIETIMELVNKYNETVDVTKPKVNLIDIARPNMTPEASKVVSDAIERSAEVMNKTKPVENGELREQLAAIEHERWADWQKWCHKVLRENNPSPEQGDILERWDRQIETPYAELSEKEKQSDRDQVDRYWQLVETYIAQEKAKWDTDARFDELNNFPTTLYTPEDEYKLERLTKLLDKENTK